MSTKPNDGGAAFPCAHRNYDYNEGMSLRDWFAGRATSADIEHYIPNTVIATELFYKKHGFYPNREWAKYQYADAMLKAREQT